MLFTKQENWEITQLSILVYVLYVFAQTCYRPGNNSSDYKKFSTRDLQQNFPGEFHFDLLIIKFKTYFVQGQNLQIQNEITWN